MLGAGQCTAMSASVVDQRQDAAARVVWATRSELAAMVKGSSTPAAGFHKGKILT